MNHIRQFSLLVGLILVMLFLAACAEAQSTSTSVPPTNTPIPPTVTPGPPTATLVPPTATEEPTATATVPSDEWWHTVWPGYASLAYDIESDQVIMYGEQTGHDANPDSYNGMTWAFDVAANTWTQTKPPSGPTRRTAANLVYDAESDRVILFGGAGGVGEAENLVWGMDETWAYDYNTNTWTEMAKGPANHIGAQLAYDAESDRIILFGGVHVEGQFFYTDTLAYDFNSDTWTEMAPSTSPPGRSFAAMVYDAAADRVLMWGGVDIAGLNPVDESVWAYDFNSNTWQEILPGDGPLPLGRDYPTMVYDVESDRTILFGGITGKAEGGDDTWAYDYNSNTWTELDPSLNPGMLSRHAMTYSTAADQVVLFGGKFGNHPNEFLRETWTYDYNTNTWTNVTPQP